jgi:hypothetical protein
MACNRLCVLLAGVVNICQVFADLLVKDFDLLSCFLVVTFSGLGSGYTRLQDELGTITSPSVFSSFSPPRPSLWWCESWGLNSDPCAY